MINELGFNKKEIGNKKGIEDANNNSLENTTKENKISKIEKEKIDQSNPVQEKENIK